MADLIEKIINGVNYKARKGGFSDPDATPEYTVKRASKAKGKNPNIYKHIVKDANGNTYEVRSKFPGKVNLKEVRSREFMDRSATIKDEAPRADGTGVIKFETPPDEKAKASIESSNKKMSGKHFKETSAEPTSNSATKSSVWDKLKNTKAGNWLKNTKAGTKASNWLKNAEAAGNWLKNTKVGSYFTDSPLTPQNVALTYKPLKGEMPIKGWRVGWRGIGPNPVAYAANAYGMGSGGGYMPVGEHTVDQLRIEHGQDDVSSLDTVVPMNPQGTMYLDPKLGFQPTEVLEDYEGGRYYRNAQTGQFEPLDYNPRYSTYVPLPRVKKVYPTDSNGVPYLNDILGGVLSMPKSDTPLPIPPMQEPYNSSAVPESQTPLPKPYSEMSSTNNDDTNKQLAPILADVGRVSPGSATASTNARVKPTVNSVVKSPRRATKPPVVNNTSNTPVVNTPEVPTSNISTPNVVTPTLSSVTSQAVRHNGGFDNYRRQSVLSALRAAGGISPAEAVQRGIIPWEALNYV